MPIRSAVSLFLALASIAFSQEELGSKSEKELLAEIQAASEAGSRDLVLAQKLSQLADLYQDFGRLSEAEALYLQALPIAETNLGQNHAEVARCLSNLAEIYYQQGKFVKSWPLAERALSIREQVLAPHHPDIARSLNNLAELSRELGDLIKAEARYVRALSILRRQKSQPDPDLVGVILSNLGTLHANKGNASRAESLFREALRVLDGAPQGKHHTRASVLANQAQLRSSAGKHSEADQLYRRALSAIGSSSTQEPLRRSILSAYADALRRANRPEEAMEIENRLR